MHPKDIPLQSIKGIGPSWSRALHTIGLDTVYDALNHFPTRYEDFRNVIPIGMVKGNSYACVQGNIRLVSARRSFRKRIGFTECLLEDASGSIKCIWLHQPYLAKTLREGESLFVAGRVSAGKYGIQFVNPMIERPGGAHVHTARIVPIYATTANITQKQLRSLIQSLLPYTAQIADPIPENIRASENLMPLRDAYRTIHFPVTLDHAEQAHHRLAVQELVNLFRSLERAKKIRSAHHATPFHAMDAILKTISASLPFTLTAGQRQSMKEITEDIGNTVPMNRLLNGDVGSGKTIIAHLLASGIATQNSKTALLAPTEILARQHFASFVKYFPKNPHMTLLFTRTMYRVHENGAVRDVTRKEINKLCGLPRPMYIIGTHTLIQKTVTLTDLSCVVIDEQHRFGVRQRASLLLREQKESAHTPHFLSLTATPIPRSLARIVLGGADVSLLEDKPPGRLPVSTYVVPSQNRERVYQAIREQIQKGHQGFIICPLIEESDVLGVKAVTQEYKMLHTIFPNMRIGLLHGKLSSTKKESVMNDFADQRLDLLVATAVVEVGVDIPNATIMLIEGAERFGLAQLHQFRGRIGRSDQPSACYAIQSEGQPNERLRAFEKTLDGFALARFDLENRGPGTIFGTLQSGFVPLKLADLRDTKLIAQTQRIAHTLEMMSSKKRADI